MSDFATIRAAIRRSLVIAMQGIGYLILFDLLMVVLLLNGIGMGHVLHVLHLFPTATTTVTSTPHPEPGSGGSATIAATTSPAEG
jgi:hypothetical protein